MVWQKVKLMKCQVDEMSSWWNVKLMKCQVDEMSSWWNVKLTKCQVDEMSSWRNVKLMKCLVPLKMFPHLMLWCLLLMGPTLGLDAKQRDSFLIKFGVCYNKSKILTILFKVKYEKSTVFSVVGVHNQQVFCMFKWRKKMVLALVLSLWSCHLFVLFPDSGYGKKECNQAPML
jgi:hypothetical protein